MRLLSSCVCSEAISALPAGTQVHTSHRSCPPPVAVCTENGRNAMSMGTCNAIYAKDP